MTYLGQWNNPRAIDWQFLHDSHQHRIGSIFHAAIELNNVVVEGERFKQIDLHPELLHLQLLCVSQNF